MTKPLASAHGVARGARPLAAPLGAALGALVAAAALGPASAQGETDLHTDREPGLIKPLIDAFTKETGVKIGTIFASIGLQERIRAEGENGPADALLTVLDR